MSSSTSQLRVVNDCLPAPLFASLRDFAHKADFGDVINPVDGVIYPGIMPSVPQWIQRSLIREIAKSMDVSVRQVKVDTCFFRVTHKNTPPAPHGAHNDISHAEYSMFFYVNDKPANLEGLAGTSLLSHKQTGLKGQPKSVEEWDIWQRDTNDYDAWHIDEMVFWEPNRMAIYPADRMHRAEPVGGWGSDQADGRLVLIMFFSC
jgi:hypothetical protein